jgi:hypothetical protein
MTQVSLIDYKRNFKMIEIPDKNKLGIIKGD